MYIFYVMMFYMSLITQYFSDFVHEIIIICACVYNVNVYCVQCQDFNKETKLHFLKHTHSHLSCKH